MTGTYSVVKTLHFTVNPNQLMSIDTPSPESTHLGDGVRRRRLVDRSRGRDDGTGVDSLHVYAYPNPGSGQAPIFLGVATVGFARSDVAALYGARYTNSGYNLTVNRAAAGMTPGVYSIVVHSHSTSGAFNNLAVVQHHPHGANVITSMTPVTASRLDYPASAHMAKPQFDSCHTIGDFAGDEFNPTQRAFMVKQDAIAAKQAKAFPVIYDHPVGVELGDRIRTAGIKWRLLSLVSAPGSTQTSRKRMLGRIAPRVALYALLQARWLRPARLPDLSARVDSSSISQSSVDEVVDLIRLHSLNQADQ